LSRLCGEGEALSAGLALSTLSDPPPDSETCAEADGLELPDL
jgi:hypothetical protein